MKLLKKIIDLILYGNFWIAICAVAMCMQSTWILAGHLGEGPLEVFVFFSTLFLYAVHRIIGISKLNEHFEMDRYAVIVKFSSHIRVYAIIGVLGSLVSFCYLNWTVRWALIIPALLSLAYVIPFLRGAKRRLRDLDDIKIFLVAVVWAWVTVLLPILMYLPDFPVGAIILIMLERTLFIFAITLPFDIRDLKVDAYSAVRTIPARIGLVRTQQLAGLCLFGVFALATFSQATELYSQAHLIAISFSVASTYWLIRYASPERHDYYFSGLLDGTMILQFLLVLALSY